MVVIYFFFAYQKWFDYEVQVLVPFFTHGPLISWLYPVFGMKGSTYFLGVPEWLFGTLIFAGFLEQGAGRTRLGRYLHCHRHDHPVHARRLGPIRWLISRHGRQRRLSHEGCRSTRRLVLSAQARRHQSEIRRQAQGTSSRNGSGRSKGPLFACSRHLEIKTRRGGPIWSQSLIHPVYFAAPCLGMLAAASTYVRNEGRQNVYCAKIFHDPHSTCPFRCNFDHLYRGPERVQNDARAAGTQIEGNQQCMESACRDSYQ